MTIMMRKQRGAAGIYMALLLIPLFGAIFLALEGTRYIQKQNRLADGAEAAALAVTMANHGNTSSYEKDLAEKYIQAYVRDIKDISQLEVTSKDGQTTIPSSEGDIEKNYTQYKVTAKTKHNSWFSSTLIPSFSPVETVANQAVARNYPEIPGERYMDIVFVSDFSGSMGGSRIRELKKAITTIANKVLDDEVDKNDEIKNRIAIVPFSERIQEKVNGQRMCSSQLSYKNKKNSNLSTVTYEQLDWSYWVKKNEGWYVSNCIRDISRCDPPPGVTKKQEQEQAKRVNDAGRFPNAGYIDYDRSIENIFKNKILSNTFHFASKGDNPFAGNRCKPNFYTLPLGNNKKDFLSKVKAMSPIDPNTNRGGRTAVYHGLLRGAQILWQGQIAENGLEKDEYFNRSKMILILTDGQESYPTIFKKLVNKGLCNKIREKFKNSKEAPYIGVLGIGYNPNSSSTKKTGYSKCVLNPKEDIIYVKNISSLLEKIDELIKKGAQTDGTSKLHYRYTD